MKARTTLLMASLLLAAVPSLNAQVVNGRFSTSVYAWEKFDTVGSSNEIWRGFQNLQLDVTQGDLSFHTYLNGASDLSGSFGDDALIRVYNGYLRWNNIVRNAEVDLGRIPVFAGVGIGTVDGLLLRSRVLEDRLTLTGYGGANVAPDLHSTGTKDLDKNFLVGGQAIVVPTPESRVGLSYVNRHIGLNDYTAIRPDSLFNPVAVLVSPSPLTEQLIGVDARCSGLQWLSLYGRYDYDINAEKSLRGELNARVQAAGNLAFTGTYIFRQPHVYTNTFFASLPLESVQEVEGGVEYTMTPGIGAFARFAYVGYTDDESRRVTIGVNCRYVGASFSGANGFSGQLTSFSIQGMMPLFERKLVPMAGFSAGTYRVDETLSPREEMYAATLGLVARPMQAFSVDAQVQWLRNKVVDSDVRAFGKVSYWFNYNFSHGQLKDTAE